MYYVPKAHGRPCNEALSVAAHGTPAKIKWYIAPAIKKTKTIMSRNAEAMQIGRYRKDVDYGCDDDEDDGDSNDDEGRLLTACSLDRLRMRTGLVTRTQLSRRSLALQTGVVMTASMRLAGRS